MKAQVEAYRTKDGARVYRLPMELFPGFWGYAHLVVAGGWTILVDAGSGFAASNDHLQEGFAVVRRECEESLAWESLSHVLVTHGHIDHFGGLAAVREWTPAPIGVHELDLRVLTNYEQRLMLVAERLERYLREAGVPEARREELMSLYLLNKQLFRSLEVDAVLQGSEGIVGPLRWLHVPGHCPGHVVFRLDDVLLVGDHLLPEISPHQSPERLTHHTGLGHYLESLGRMLRWAGDIRLALGGHQGPIHDVPSRVEAIRRMHAERLARVLELLEVPRTVADVAEALFPGAGGYHALLAVQEAGAHVEYLEQRGHLVIDNLDELRRGDAAAIRYRRRSLAMPAPSLLLDPEPEPARAKPQSPASV